jgi:hypothetical protein
MLVQGRKRFPSLGRLVTFGVIETDVTSYSLDARP